MDENKMIQMPSQTELATDSNLEEDLVVSSSILSDIDMQSPDLIPLSNYEIETLFSAMPTLAVAGITNSTIKELGHLQLYTVTRNGMPISPNELIQKKDGALLGMIADIKGHFAASADILPADLKSIPKVQLLNCTNIAMAVYAVLAAITQKKYLDKINKNLSQLNAEVGAIKMYLTEAQRAKVNGAMKQLEDINTKKEAVLNSPEIKAVMLNQIAQIKGVAEESRAFYSRMVQGDTNKYLVKTKNKKAERIKKGQQKEELFQDLLYYEIGNEIHALAELFTLFFDGQYKPEYLELLRNDFANREHELEEIKRAVSKALTDVDLRKPSTKFMLGITSIETTIEKAPEALQAMPGFLLPFPYGHTLEKKVGQKIGIDITELSKKKNAAIKESAAKKASKEIQERQIGDLTRFIESVDKMDRFYNQPIKLLKNQDSYYLLNAN